MHPFDLEYVNKARELALYAHNDQKYGNDKPYSYHLDHVTLILNKEFENTLYLPTLLITGYLHDVLEDTTLPKFVIDDIFGSRICRLIELLTDDPTLETRADRKAAKNYELAKIKDSWEELALIVKVADRLANVESTFEIENHVITNYASLFGNKKIHLLASNTRKNKLLKMYSKEHFKFKEAVYRKDLCNRLWERLDALINEISKEIV